MYVNCRLFYTHGRNPDRPLAQRIGWPQFDVTIDDCYAEELGRPGVNTWPMVGLLYLKHAFDESDESIVARWVENSYWQFFCGCQYMQQELDKVNIDTTVQEKAIDFPTDTRLNHKKWINRIFYQ